MDKICSVARLLAVILAIVSAFVVVPYAAVALLVLGAISAINNSSENNIKTYLATIVLIVGAKTLVVVPVAGEALATIFTGLGIAFTGASLLAITIRIVMRIKSDWI